MQKSTFCFILTVKVVGCKKLFLLLADDTLKDLKFGSNIFFWKPLCQNLINIPTGSQR